MAAVAFMHGMSAWPKKPYPSAFLAYQCIIQSCHYEQHQHQQDAEPLRRPRDPYKTPAFEPLHDRSSSISATTKSSSKVTRERDLSMMMDKGGAATTVAVVALVLLAAAATARADVSCADVDASLRPCVGYVTGKEAAPAAECCAGVKKIRGMPSGTAERRQACECVKQAAAGYQPLNADAIRDLPSRCGAPLPFPLTLNFDCTTIP